MRQAEIQGCLAGLRVVDLSTSVVGLQASQHLADNGAEVIFVEPPDGTIWRSHPSWPLWMRGKSIIQRDLLDSSQLGDVLGLVERSDVVLETFRPGVADRLGVGYEAIRTRAPHVVVGSVTGFGRSGPYASIPAYEGTVMAALGIMHAYSAIHDRTGPVFASPWMCSASATQVLLQGVLAALVEREHSGLGQHVETTLVDAIASQDLNNFTHLFLQRRFPDAFEGAPFMSPEGVPNSGMAFRTLVALTKDGRWLQFGQLSDRLFRSMMRALGLEWMFDDPRWASAPEFDDVPTRLEFWEHMLRAARTKTLDEWLRVFDEDRDVWAEIYRRHNELLDHPQLVFDGRVSTVHTGLDEVKAPGLLVHFDGTPGAAAPAPRQIDELVLSAVQTKPASPVWSDETPLAGVTILELGMYFAGPLAATMLADLGARVIKVEAFEGDPGRSFTGFPEAGGTRTMQGKESIAVDLSTEDGRRIVHRLAERADIVLQSFRAGVADRLGLDAATIRSINPQAIYVDAPGYGTQGPCGDRPAFAPTIGAASGFALRNVGPSVPERADLSLEEIKRYAGRLFPATIIVGHADAFAAHAVATAMLMGLLARLRGRGAQRLETSMLATMSHVLSDQMVESPDVPKWREPDEDMYGCGPLYRLYESANGWLFLAVVTDREWVRFVDALGDDRLRAAPFDTTDGRLAHGAALADLLQSIFLTADAAHWERRMIAVGVACVIAREQPPAEILMDNVLAVEPPMVVEVEHPLWDAHPRLAPAVRLSRSRTVAPAGCLCGQHTSELLVEFGYSESEIDHMRKEGIVQ